MSRCCAWAQFNFSSFSLSLFPSQLKLSSTQLKLSSAGPKRSDCGVMISSYIFLLLQFNIFQLCSAQAIFSSSAEAQLISAGPTRSDWGVLISSHLFSLQIIIFQLNSAHLFQLSWSSAQLNSAEAQLVSAGPTRSDWGVLISSRHHTPVSQPRLSFSPHHHFSQFHAVWEKNVHMMNFSILCSRHKWKQFVDTKTIFERAITSYCCGFVCLQIWVRYQPVLLVRFLNPLPSSKPVQLCFDLQIWSLKNPRRWSSRIQSAAFLEPVPAPDCLLGTKYAHLLTLSSISS